MPRIEPSDVLDGGFSTELTTSEVGDRLGDAHHLVAARLEGDGSDYSADRLDQIEKYLTRHLIRVGPDRQIDSGQGASTSLDYSGDFDHEGLRATSPGQTVLLLDEDNKLGDTTASADFEVF